MKLIDQFRSINQSAVAVTLAQAFIVGYAVPMTTYVLPHFFTSDFVGAGIDFYAQCLSNPAWLYIFFKATLNSGISFAIGALMKTNAFDKFKTLFPGASATMTDFRTFPSDSPTTTQNQKPTP